MKTIQIKINILLLGTLCLFLILSCKKEDRMKVPPEIRNLSISKDTMRQGQMNDDHLFISFDFYNQYGEGGADSNSDSLIIILTDLRLPFALTPYYVYPPLEPSIINEEKGKIEIKFFQTCCVNPPQFPPCDQVPNYFESVSYEIEFQNNLGYDIPKDTISFWIDCSY